jgi:alpha-glucoside transport system permease protein
VAIDTEEPTAPAEPVDEEPGGSTARVATTIGLRTVAVVVGVIVAFIAVGQAFDFMRDRDANRFLVIAVALAVGVGGIFVLFWAMDRAVNLLPRDVSERVRPYAYVGPALVILTIFLIYPVVNTIVLSFKDKSGSSFVGLDNYHFVFTDPSMLRSIRNSMLWIVLVPLCAVSIGLLFATLADRLRRGEAVAKSLIFLPMAISFVGASVVWRLIYSYRPQGFGSNVGLLNGIKLGLGQDPVAWLSQRPWNNLLLIVVMIWIQTGFAMIVLSAAIKSIPTRSSRRPASTGRRSCRSSGTITVPSDPAHDRGGHDLHDDQRHEGLRHRVRHGQRRVQRDRGHRRAHDQWFFLSNNDGGAPRSPSCCSSRSSR